MNLRNHSARVPFQTTPIIHAEPAFTDILLAKTRVLHGLLEKRVVSTQLLSSRITLNQYFEILSRFHAVYSQLEKYLLQLEKRIEIAPAEPFKPRLIEIEHDLNTISEITKAKMPQPMVLPLSAFKGAIGEQYWGIRFVLDEMSLSANAIKKKLNVSLARRYNININFWQCLCEVAPDWNKSLRAINNLEEKSAGNSELIYCAQEAYLLLLEKMAGVFPDH